MRNTSDTTDFGDRHVDEKWVAAAKHEVERREKMLAEKTARILACDHLRNITMLECKDDRDSYICNKCGHTWSEGCTFDDDYA